LFMTDTVSLAAEKRAEEKIEPTCSVQQCWRKLYLLYLAVIRSRGKKRTIPDKKKRLVAASKRRKKKKRKDPICDYGPNQKEDVL